MRWVLTLKYDGKNYSGSQIQPNAKTIQGELERTLRTFTTGAKGDLPANPANSIKTVFSGRTDAGVSAMAQVVHFDFDGELSCDAINELLPKDIQVTQIRPADGSFHAQKSAKLKHYRYELDQEIGHQRAQAALNHLLGEHDFTSFKCAGTANPSRVCFIKSAVINGRTIDIVGDRFLYKMIRTIVGTLLFIEKEDLEAGHMKAVIEAKDRTKAGKTASPYGLTLVEVIY